MLVMERSSTSPDLLPAHSLPSGRVYTPRHTQFALDEHRDGCLGEHLAASYGVQLLPFSGLFPDAFPGIFSSWIFPSITLILRDQCKIDLGSRATSGSTRSSHSSTFLHSSDLMGPTEVFAKILRKSQEFFFPGFVKTFLLIKQPKKCKDFHSLFGWAQP